MIKNLFTLLSTTLNYLKESRYASILRRILKWGIYAILVVGGLALLLGLAHIVQYGLSAKSLNRVAGFMWSLTTNPLKLLAAYQEWFVVAWHSWQKDKFSLGMAIPLLIIPVLLVALMMFLRRLKNFTRLHFALRQHFATEIEIQKMGLFDGFLMFLGRCFGRNLKLPNTYSVWALGESGMGKTSGVAIPAILETDRACVLAVDDSGILAKYTSGYRAQLGPVFYFDWRLKDNPEKGEYWPRWNPLSMRNLPRGGNKREHYIWVLSKALLGLNHNNGEENYWDRLSLITLDGLLQFFTAKVEQATANDYFLTKISEKGSVFREDRELLLSYYALMPEKVSQKVIAWTKTNKLNWDNYLPVGSWGGIPEEWQGREMCMPMFADFLIQRYFLIAQELTADDDVWKLLLEEFLEEAALFGYPQRVKHELRQIFYLSKQQRNIVFPMILKPLTVFRNKVIRERTSVSDFYLRYVRGVKNQYGNWQVSTIYNVYNQDYMSRFFVDMLIEDALVVHRSAGEFPLLVVMDDLAKLPKYSALDDGLNGGLEAKISFLLISNSLQSVQEIYGVERLENIIAAATFKLMTADNNKNLSKELEELAGLSTKSVQIPKIGNKSILNLRHGVSDGSYFRRIAKALNSHREDEQFSRGYHLLLAEGFYHRPIRAQAEFFLNNSEMIEKSALKPKCFVALETWQKRNPQDLNPPLLIEVLKNSGIKIEKGDDVDAFIAKAFEKAEEFKAQIPDKTSVLTEEITSKWSSRKVKFEPEKLQQMMNENSDDWWMTEKSFELPEDASDEAKAGEEERESLELSFSKDGDWDTENEHQPIEDEQKYVVTNPDDI